MQSFLRHEIVIIAGDLNQNLVKTTAVGALSTFWTATSELPYPHSIKMENS